MEKITTVPSLKQILTAHKTIKPYIHQTPVISNASINKLTGASIFFKCENFQKIGAFKMRGATCATMALTDKEKTNGIATHSSGNHAQAVALSAKNHNINAYIVMPSSAPVIKRKATEGYGANIITCNPTIAARQSTLDQVVAKTNATFIHPFDNYNVIAGQATAAIELIEEVGRMDIVMAPIGGGGLMSGTALGTHYLLPDTQIIGTEPERVDDAYLSFQKGEIVKNKSINSIADGLLTNLSPKTFNIIKEHLNEIITVSEQQIIQAMRLIWERMKIIVEPSSAVPLAAILKQKERFLGQKIGLILTGGNVDINNLPF
ncbi:MAG: threonine/serine dehydratase [Saprospiraceae bacterium]|nr:threonine/serine dehydratase [Saprospiraceae bacterium]